MTAVAYNGDGTSTVKVNACLEYTHVTSRFKILFMKLDRKIYSDIDKELIDKLADMQEHELAMSADLIENDAHIVALVKKIRRLEKTALGLGLLWLGTVLTILFFI